MKQGRLTCSNKNLPWPSIIHLGLNYMRANCNKNVRSSTEYIVTIVRLLWTMNKRLYLGNSTFNTVDPSCRRFYWFPIVIISRIDQ